MAHFPYKDFLPFRLPLCSVFSPLPSLPSHLQVIHALAGQLGRDPHSRDGHLLSCLGPTPLRELSSGFYLLLWWVPAQSSTDTLLVGMRPSGPSEWPRDAVSARKLLCLPIFNYPVRHRRARQSSQFSPLPPLASLSLHIQHGDDSSRHCSTQTPDREVFCYILTEMWVSEIQWASKRKIRCPRPVFREW